MRRDLYWFLFCRGALLGFVINKRNCKKLSSKSKSYSWNWIDAAFYWKDTDEGFDYWKDLDGAWSIYLIKKYGM